MKNIALPLIAVTLSAPVMAQTSAAPDYSYVSKAWMADLGNGYYQNPILYADYSDPDVCRVGDDFYMTASSFNCVPGLPILHSRDLVNWTIIGYALDRLVPAEAYDGAQTASPTTVTDGRIFIDNSFDRPRHGDGVWAPAIRYHNGEFFIYWGDPDNGIFMVKTKDPAGRWSAPVLVHKSKGIIDTCPFWDEDGRAYIGHGFAGSRAGLKSILGLIEMTPDGTATIGEDCVIYDGHVDNVTIEGVKLYKREGYYYILCPAGGVPTGYQLAMRSKSIYGPYDWKIVMAEGKSGVNGPHQGGLVDTPDGSENWFIHFQDVDAYGRIAHLQPVTWVDGWPVMGIDKDGDLCGDPVIKHKKPNLPKQTPCAPVESDDFNHTGLGLQWQWHSNSNALWSFADQKMGVLRLFSWPWKDAAGEPVKNLWGVGNLLLQKFPAPNFKATAKVRFHPSDKHVGERCGLVVMGLDYAGLVMTNKGDVIEMTQVECKGAKKGTAESVNSDAVSVAKDQYVWLRVEVKKKGADAICTFSYSTDGKKFTKFGKEFTAQPGQWIGAKTGLFCTREKQVTNDGGWMDADEFIVDKL